MKNFLKYPFTMAVFVTAALLISWIASLVSGSSDQARLEECQKRQRIIEQNLDSGNYCRQDSDCRAVQVPCPWGEEEKGCYFVIVNRNHSVSALQNDFYQFGQCLTQQEAFAESSARCGAQKVGEECSFVQALSSRCVDNRCVRSQ